MSTFEFRGKSVFYQVDGVGKPILLLNGIMMSTKSWNAFLPSLSASNQLIRVDFLDQGQSDRLIGETYTQSLQVELLSALLNHLHLAKASIVGISYGGAVAIQFAIAHPDQTDRLILFNSTAYTSPWLRDIGRGWVAAGKTRNGQQYYLTTIPVIYSPAFYESHLDWMKKREAFLIPVFSNPEFLDQMERLTLSAEPFDVRESLHLVRAKTLVVSADMDYLTPPHHQEELVKRIQGCEWIKIPGAGHASMYEKPLLFTSLVLGFINALQTEFTI